MISTIITLSIASLLVLLFILVASKDLAMLVRRPNKYLGTGLSRVWAVAHTTLYEAWAGRVWILPILWFVAAMILIIVVRPYDPSERIPLDIRVILFAQEIFILVMIGAMACLSLPRERERKIVITNASKPLSRLEIILGKMLGFTVTSFFLLVVMSVISYLILLGVDYKIRHDAAREYQLAQLDYNTKMEELQTGKPASNDKPLKPLPEEKKLLAQDGSLHAYNYVTPPKDGLSIVGDVESTPNGAVRFLKGGSEEKAVYTFAPMPPADINADALSTGQRPCFVFDFSSWKPYPNTPPTGGFAIQVTATRIGKGITPRVQEQRLLLTRDNNFRATWEPVTPLDLFASGPEDYRAVEVTVNCMTPGVLLQIKEGKKQTPDDFNVLAFPRFLDGKPFAPGFQHQPNPVVRAFEKYDKQQVEGPNPRELARYGPNVPLEAAIFRFKAADLKRVPIDHKDQFAVSFVLDVDKEENQFEDTRAIVVAYNEAVRDLKPFVSQQFHVLEKRSTPVSLPAALLGDPSGKNAGDLVILLRCTTPGHWLGVNEAAARLERPPSYFFINLLKSEAIILCEAALLSVIAVAFSVRLGWPVAMLLTAFCYTLGFCRDFISEILESGGLSAMGWTVTGQESTTFKFFDHFVGVIWKLLHFIIFLLPDFSRFDSLIYITQLRSTPWLTLAADTGFALLYALPFIALGYLLIRKQELG